MLLCRILIGIAVISALYCCVNIQLRLVMYSNILHSWTAENTPIVFYHLRFADDAERKFPFAWQRGQQQQLRAELSPPQDPPSGDEQCAHCMVSSMPVPPGDDTHARARYAQYAMGQTHQIVFREGLRRDPDNALYDYLLAKQILTICLDQSKKTRNAQTGELQENYIVTDRHALDEAMRHFSDGLGKPLRTYQHVIMSERLFALPSIRHYDNRIDEDIALADIKTAGFTDARKLASVNSFYLSLLLSEGKRAQAEPFLHAGERLVVQLANDLPLSLHGQMLAYSVGMVSMRNDARVCRSFKFEHEAEMIESRLTTLLKRSQEQIESGSKTSEDEVDLVLSRHGSTMTKLLLPPFRKNLMGALTKENLTASRLAEYLMLERTLATLLVLLSFGALANAVLSQRWAKREIELEMPCVRFSAAEWMRICVYGLLAPLMLYCCYIMIPAISGRDYSALHAWWQFLIGAGLFALWTLVVPLLIALTIAVKRNAVNEQPGVVLSRHARWFSLLRVMKEQYDDGFAVGFLLFPFSWLVIALLFLRVPFSNVLLAALIILGAAALLVLIVRKPARRPQTQRRRAISRALLPVYLVSTLFFASLAPLCAALEDYYLLHDKVSAIMRDGHDLALTRSEGETALMLCEGVRDGAEELGISWE